MKRFNFNNKPLVESPYPPQDTNVLWVDVDESTGKVASVKKFLRGEWVDYLIFVPEPEIFNGPANNEIWYTTVDGQPYDFQSIIEEFEDESPYVGPNVISNVFDSNKKLYIMTFDATITQLGPTRDATGDELLFNAPFLANPSMEQPIIQNIWLPQSVTTLNYLAYFNIAGEEIRIPKGVTTIGSTSIYNNRNLKKLILPNTLTKIPLLAIYFNPELRVIEFEGTVAQWNRVEKERDVNTDGEISLWIDGCPLVVEVQCTDGNVPIL